MIYKECLIAKEELFHVTEHQHYYVNPYFGCSEGCPYCYWTVVPGWEGQISARLNVVEVFEKEMQTWDRGKRLCFGSYCNPYESIESKYRLMRGLLNVVKKYHIPFVLTTSSSLILDDTELIASMKDQAIIVFEFSRVERLVSFNKTGLHEVMDAANKFAQMGVTVLATVAPYLAEISDLDAILERLDDSIPIYIDSLDFNTNPTTAERLLPVIKMHKPECLAHYRWLTEGDNAMREFQEIAEKYKDNPRVKSFPFEIQYENCFGGEN